MNLVNGQWFVLDYVVAVLADERLTNDRMHRFAERAPAQAVDAIRRHAAWMISPEGADYDWVGDVVHAGLRGAVSTASRQAIAAAADELLDELLARDAFDLVSDYALALSGHVLADFLGVDRRDGARLMRWAHDLVAFFNDVEVDVAAADRMARSAAEMTAYAHALLTETPGALREGFLEQAARAAAGHGQVLDDHGLGNLTLAFLTGQIGVAQLVVNTVWLVLDHDDQRARLAADPTLLGGAIAEALRYLPPVALIPRIASERVVVRGHVVEAGQVVQLSVAAANRDPVRFPNPDRFDIAHRNPGALGFGHGPHACVGAGLSRIQSQIALQALLRRAPDIERDPDETVAWWAQAGLLGPEALPVRPTAARAARRAR